MRSGGPADLHEHDLSARAPCRTTDNLDETQAHSRFYPQRLPAEVLLDAVDAVTGAPTDTPACPPGRRRPQLPDEDAGNLPRPLRPAAARERLRVRTGLEAEPDPGPLPDERRRSSSARSRPGAGWPTAWRRTGGRWRRGSTTCSSTAFCAGCRPRTSRAGRWRISRASRTRSEAFRNLVWVLLNTKEFLYIH